MQKKATTKFFISHKDASQETLQVLVCNPDGLIVSNFWINVKIELIRQLFPGINHLKKLTKGIHK